MKTKKLATHGKKKWHHHAKHALVEIAAGHFHISILLALIGEQAENAEVNSKEAKKLIDKYMTGMIAISMFVVTGVSVVTWLTHNWLSLPFYIPAWDFNGNVGTIILSFFWAWSAGRIIIFWIKTIRFNKKAVEQGFKGIRFLLGKMIDCRTAGDGSVLLLEGITLWQVKERISIQCALNSGIRPIVATTKEKSTMAFNDYFVGNFSFVVDDEITYYEKEVTAEEVEKQLRAMIDAAWLHVLNIENLESIEAIEKKLIDIEPLVKLALVDKLTNYDNFILLKQVNIHKRQFEAPKLVALAA